MNKPNIQIWDVEKLIPYEQNVKVHDKKQIAAIAKSLSDFNWNQPISVDKDGVIIAGHGRRLAVYSLLQVDERWRKVPVWIRDDLSPDQVRALRLVDNKVAESAIDTEMFRKELEDLDFNLDGYYSEKELDFAIADLGDLNADAFVTDVAGAVDAQDTQTKETAAEVLKKPVAIGKLLGFDKVSGKNQLVIGRLMAEIEHRTSQKGEEALVGFYQQLTGESSK